MIPIIIFHIGNTDYLKIAINQALSFNNIVYLIGDDSNKSFCDNHYNWLQYRNNYFEKIYKHVSPNNINFEKICIERWIIINNFMKTENIEKAFICDSDVLLYCNINNIINEYYTNDFYISTTTTFYNVTAGQSIWSLNKLSSFVEFIFDFYNNNIWEYIINYWYNYDNKLYGGISDMYLLYCFITKTNFKDNHFVLDNKRLSIEYDLTQPKLSSFFDNSIDLDCDTFLINRWKRKEYLFNIQNMENKIKKFDFINNIPYCYNLNTNENNRVYSIHFHRCKTLMKEYSTFINYDISSRNKIYTVSSIVFSLNDNYTEDNKERFIISMNSMIHSVDEIIYIDWGSPNNISLMEEPYILSKLTNINKIKHIKFTREEIKKIVPEDRNFIQHSIIRNIGIRNTSCDYIISTNIDIIFPSRSDIQDILCMDNLNTFYTINRKNIDMNFVQSIYNVSYPNLNNILEEYVKLRNLSNDIEPIKTFEKEAFQQLYNNTLYYNSYLKYAKIWNCGDFQLAHRNIWLNIKGFEENMDLSAYCTDTNVQKKIFTYGYELKILNYPHIFHMDHPHRSNNKNQINSLERFLINFKLSENNDNWGNYYNNQLSNQISNRKKLLWVSDYSYSGYTMVANLLIPYIENNFDIYFFVINNINLKEDEKQKIIDNIYNSLNIKKENVYINSYTTSNNFENIIGIYDFEYILKNINPDYLFTLNDYKIITTQIEFIYNKCSFWNGKKICYMPIDSENYRNKFFEKLNYFDYIFTMTEKSKKIIKATGFNKSIMVLPHPYNKSFYPKLNEKNNLQNKFLFNKIPIKIDKNDIIIINNNANCIRKKLDITIESFYLLHTYKIINSSSNKFFLYLKTDRLVSNIINSGLHIKKFISIMNNKYHFDLSDKIIIDTNKYCIEELNDIYNMCDIYLSTTSGEGWGLTAFEALNCNLYTLVPNNTSYSEYFLEELLIKTETKCVGEVRNNISISQKNIDGYVFIQGYLKNYYNCNYVPIIIHDNDIKTLYHIDIYKDDFSLLNYFTTFKNLENKPESFEIYIKIDSPEYKYSEIFINQLLNIDLKDFFNDYNINLIHQNTFDSYIVKNKIPIIEDICDKIIYYYKNKDLCKNMILKYKTEILKNLHNDKIGKLFNKYINIISSIDNL